MPKCLLLDFYLFTTLNSLSLFFPFDRGMHRLAALLLHKLPAEVQGKGPQRGSFHAVLVICESNTRCIACTAKVPLPNLLEKS